LYENANADVASGARDLRWDGADMALHTTKTTPDSAVGTMRAIVQEEYGTAEVLRLEQVDIPKAAAGEVLVRVNAAGLDRGTWHLLTGRPYLMRIMGFGFRAPRNRVPGLDVAGTVVAVGSAVTRFAVGDEVFGISRGSFAEYAVALEEKLARKPANRSFEQAAVVPISGITALQALRDSGHIQSGQRVLVIGASGGVGSYAVQLAVASGAEVTGVASTQKLDLVRALGAVHVVDYTVDDFTDGTNRYDLVLDIGGNAPVSHLRRALAPRGTLVFVGGEDGGRVTGGFGRQLRAVALSPFLRQRLTMLASKERGTDLDPLTDLIESGEVTPSLERVYPLEQAADALRHLEDGSVRGKLAITPLNAASRHDSVDDR
jgi:NADPH:quinone reductase-like Zn-dependent oxidoreductase